MSMVAIVVLAFGMAMDAFAAALVRGASLSEQLRLPCLLRMALVFGVVETAMPLLGFVLGSAAGSLIQQWDHWLAFVLLGLLGGKMVYEGLCETDVTKKNVAIRDDVPQGRLMLLATAFATSIDSLIVGVGLAFLDVNIWLTAATIGITTTLMAALGLRLGHFFGATWGKRAEVAGGVLLMGIGCWVLMTHLAWV
ncbi:MAG: manganese efflux pump MntP family protein [Alysiella sp.]|uniref:manganese efflux pump MntP n=1 Tax=Alysiella sp. TaxID=1872483 RepID=UPI0026DCA910|nr:manganese efflux pump MntP family protein [Alysiella sp.]MDO4433254.1 manganese efflux pump MntP family protein [Alysiella sp.]